MPEHVQRETGLAEGPFAFPAGNFAPVFHAVKRTGDVYGKACLALQDEFLRFANTRLQQDAAFGTNLLKCAKWTDAARLQQGWAAEAMSDYVTEATRLLELATNLTNDVTRSSTAEVGAAVEGMHNAGRTAVKQLAMTGAAMRRTAEGIPARQRGSRRTAAKSGNGRRRAR